MGITVEQLLKACIDEYKKGNGKKKIYLSNDDEGNGYHQMFYLFSDEQDEIKELDMWKDIDDYSNAIILG